MALIDKETIPPIQPLNRNHVAKIIELWQDVEHDVEWCNEPSEFMYDEVLRRFKLGTLPEKPMKGLGDEAESYWIEAGWSKVMTLGRFKTIARHFYELGLNARKDENQ